MTFPDSIQHLDPSPVLAEAVVLAGTGGALYWSGSLECLDSGLRVGIVGTRDPSQQGRDCVDSIAEKLARGGATVISGAAQGTDTAAHLAALKAGGSTVAVVPLGLGRINIAWRPELMGSPWNEQLILISPFQLPQPPNRQTPVIRNRLIAALSEVLVVGEASPTSGTMHCVRAARQFGVPLFVLRAPGKVTPAHQQQLEAGGATMFNAAEAGSPELAQAILRAAAKRRSEAREIREQQLRLFE